jgi:CRP-like cAMP-binding protein
MDQAALARLAATLEEKNFGDGETVFAEGDPGDSMHFILNGCVHIEKRVQAATEARKTLAVLEAGDYFGEMALLDQKPRSASAVAAGGARILSLSKAAFDQMQSQGGVAGMSVLFAMIRTSGERIRRLSTQVVVYEVGKAIGESRDLQTLLDVILRQLSQPGRTGVCSAPPSSLTVSNRGELTRR